MLLTTNYYYITGWGDDLFITYIIQQGGNAMFTLPAGYLGSSLIGAILVMCGFNIFASKVASIFLGTCLLLTLWWAKNWLTRGIGIAFIGIMLILWFVAHGVGLKYFVLFLGVMSCLYCLWDILDDLVFRKAFESDASKFAELYGLSSRTWGVIWFLVSLVFFACGIIVGLVAFKGNKHISLGRGVSHEEMK